MSRLRELFTSPEYYPVRIDLQKRRVKFVRMSLETYRDSIFLDLRTKHTGSGIEIRLDDLLLAATAQSPVKPVHYILHISFCCSTLLARYFELLPSCFVLKEPRLLAQIAVMLAGPGNLNNDAFDLAVKLLTRTYESGQMVVIKPNDWCNSLARKLLAHNSQATITFLMAPLKKYLLSILKAEERRDWVRNRIRTAVKEAAGHAQLAHVNIDQLSVAQATAYLWLTHRFVCEQLVSNGNRSRVLVLNGEELLEDPASSLHAIMKMCGLAVSEEELQHLISHPSISKYSKDLSRPYDAVSRQKEMEELQNCWGREADAGIEFALAHGGSNLEHW
jgi:Sulfotransferase domain